MHFRETTLKYDAKENGVQINGVVRNRYPVRSNWNLKGRLLLIKNMLFEEDRERSPKPTGLL